MVPPPTAPTGAPMRLSVCAEWIDMGAAMLLGAIHKSEATCFATKEADLVFIKA